MSGNAYFMHDSGHYWICVSQNLGKHLILSIGIVWCWSYFLNDITSDWTRSSNSSFCVQLVSVSKWIFSGIFLLFNILFSCFGSKWCIYFCSWILAEDFCKSQKHTNHVTLSAIRYHDHFSEPKQLGKFGGKFMNAFFGKPAGSPWLGIFPLISSNSIAKLFIIFWNISRVFI